MRPRRRETPKTGANDASRSAALDPLPQPGQSLRAGQDLFRRPDREHPSWRRSEFSSGRACACCPRADAPCWPPGAPASMNRRQWCAWTRHGGRGARLGSRRSQPDRPQSRRAPAALAVGMSCSRPLPVRPACSDLHAVNAPVHRGVSRLRAALAGLRRDPRPGPDGRAAGRARLPNATWKPRSRS